jgi:hypothetical protein
VFKGENEMSEYVTFFTGNKGGLGKSEGGKSYTEYRMNSGMQVVTLDCDGGNPDLAKTFGDDVSYNFLSADGFLDLINSIEAIDKTKEIVVNFPAGSNEAAKQNGQAFLEALPSLSDLVGRPLRVVWVIDNKRDVLESLHDFVESAPGVHIDILMNLHHGQPHTFQLFHQSKIRQKILNAGGKIIMFPALAVRVMAAKSNDYKTVSELLKILPLGDRIELQRWWKEVKLAFDNAGYGGFHSAPRKRRV